ncbi:MAG: hypothetical protein ACK47B_18275 [Armatimonadota bacterium]
MNSALWLGAGLLAGAALSPLLPPLLRRLGLQRVNFQGQPIGTAAGLGFLLAALPWLIWAPGPHAAALLGFGLLGLLDDRWGTADYKGFRGHLRALRGGRVTTGAVKALGGGLLACLLAWWLQPGFGAVAGAALIALSANLFNLLDLRPLRSLKVFWLFSAALLLLPGPAILAQTLGHTLGYAPWEARKKLMLGDTGANALGGLVGVSLTAALPLWAQAAAAALLLALHAWAERNSLSRWIEAHPLLRAVDEWGR